MFLLMSDTTLKTSDDFQRVYRRRCCFADRYLLVYTAPNDLGLRRLGVSVSRKWGNAVRRNRIKRLYREAFRKNRDSLPQNIDIIMIPRTANPITLAQCSKSLIQLTKKAGRTVRSRSLAVESVEESSGRRHESAD